MFSALLVIPSWAGPLKELCKHSPEIVSVRILKLVYPVSMSDMSPEFIIKARVWKSAKGKLKPKEEIKVVIRLPFKESRLLGLNPFGLKVDGVAIFFLKPQYAADGKTFIHYRFADLPFGCLPFDHYTWKRVHDETKSEQDGAPDS